MRLSDAEREAMLEALKGHAAAGRLDVAELEVRVERVLVADTLAQAAPALADLPPLGPPAAVRGRHAEAGAAAPGWEPTDERFRDPRSGRIMRVWVDGAGGRHYISE